MGSFLSRYNARAQGSCSLRFACASLASLAMAVAMPFAVHAQDMPKVEFHPDLCATPEVILPTTSKKIPGVGKSLEYWLNSDTAPPVNPNDPWSPKIVLIVNGNSFNALDYTLIAAFLAQQGFIPVVVERSNNSSPDPAIVKQALDAVFADLSLPQNTPVALVGHSLGGGIVVTAAQMNATAALPYALKAVVSLSPNATNAPALTPAAVSNLLVVYGSQDEDMSGEGGVPREGFALYDRAGTEATTTCTDALCLVPPGTPLPLERTMVYIHGADHPGLIGKAKGFTNIENEFVHFTDQFCVAKSYTGGFLRWKMLGESNFKGMFRDEWRGTTVAAMTSSKPDYMGNAAGSPLRMAVQASPRFRRVVENFQDGVWTGTTPSPAMQFQLLDEGDLSGAPMLVRHETRALIAGWSVQPQWQLFSIDVPMNSRNTINFSDLAVRVGLLHGAPAAFKNAVNTDGKLWIGLDDGNALEWEALHDWGTILRSDVKKSGIAAISAMNTIAVPLGAYTSVNRHDIKRIFFTVQPNTRGTVLIDNIEFWKD
jgi:hypothetical protein